MTSTPSPDGHDCPCGRSSTFGGVLSYERCCGRYLDDASVSAPDAESLMRSRYTAYALGRHDYVLATWDPAHRPARLNVDSARWTGLRVLDHRSTAPDAAEVEFVAGYADRRSGQAGELWERSRFTLRDGRWWYLDAGDHRTDPVGQRRRPPVG